MLSHPLHGLPQPVGLLMEGGAPTKAYWLQSALEALQPQQWIELHGANAPDHERLEQLGSLVVVRRLPGRWLHSLRQLRSKGKPVVLVLDDALLDPATVAEQHWHYRWRLWFGLTRHRHHLDQLVSDLWVTTSWLAEHSKRSLQGQGIQILQLTLQPPLSLLHPRRIHRIAYLGSASHSEEWLWLLPLLEALQQRRSDCLLELVLPPAWRRRFRHLPRTRLFYPMDWETYLLDTGNRQVDLLLTPLLSSRFNQGRSPTKFFEAARLQAAGLFSNRAPYAGFVRDGHDGLLLDDAQESWLQAIEQLLENTVQRQTIADYCFQRAEKLCVR